MLAKIELTLTSWAAKLGPWLAPIAPAYFVGRAVQVHLATPALIAITIAVAIEATGIAATHNAQLAYNYNRDKRKIDPPAPLGLCVALAGLYLLIGVALACLEAWPNLTPYAPSLLFLLAGVGYASLAVGANQTRRESLALADRERRRKPRTQPKQPSAAQPPDPALDEQLTLLLSKTNGTAFGLSETQEATGLGRTKSYELLSYAKQSGAVTQTTRGTYQAKGG